MTSTLKYDSDTALLLEKWYQFNDIKKQQLFVLNKANCKEGEHILDIGVGPGFLAKDLAKIIGNNGFLYAIDISETMINLATTRCLEYSSFCLFEIGNACDLKHPYSKQYDCIISTQVYEYVKDIKKALNEAYSVLKPGGRIIILDTDSDSIVWYSNNKDRMNKILKVNEEYCIHPNLPQYLKSLLVDCGFINIQTEIFGICNTELSNDTYSYALLSSIEQFVIGKQGITKEIVQKWKEEQEQLNKENKYFFSLNRYLFIAHKPHD